jgi:hypothetical protein
VTEPAAPLASNYHNGEAGAVAFTDMYTVKGAKVSITARSTASAEDVCRAIDALVAGMKYANSKYGWDTVRPGAAPVTTPAAPKADPAAQTAANAGNPQMAAAIQSQGEAVPPSKKGVPYKTLELDIFEVLPQPDNKTSIKFYGTGDDYARISVNKWSVENANALMKHVLSNDMSQAGRYTLPVVVYYTDGKAFTMKDGKTGNYKDVEHVRPR